MQFTAKARYLKYSPYKIRLLADVIRGKNALYALQWLTTYKTRRTEVVKKLIESAVANAKNLQGIESNTLHIAELRVDQGPMHRYFKPGARGCANVQRKRSCHMSVILEVKEAKYGK